MSSSGFSIDRSVLRRSGDVVLGVATVLTLLLFIAACSSSSDTTSSTAAPAVAGAAQVVMKDIAFDPSSVTIKVGGTVTWTNEDGVTHTVTADNGEFDSGELAQGDTFSFTFEQAGTYPYHCTIHPNMTATVIVE